MTRNLAIVFALTATLTAQADMGLYNRALSAFNSGDYAAAAAAFYELEQTATEPDLRAKSEYYLAQSFHKMEMPVTAFIYYTVILKAGKAHPFYLKAVEGMVNVQKVLDDQFLIPNQLNNNYNEEWATLPLEVLARINYLIGGISQRKLKFDEAKSFLEAVPTNTTIYAKAQYLLGIVLSDQRYPGGPKVDEAIAAFERVTKLVDPGQEGLAETQQLSHLAVGRLYYGMGQFQKSVDAYESIPRFSKFWDQALFENGWARFLNEDAGGSLGSLQALHAPQFVGAFQPESWYLKSVIYYDHCLYEEAKSALSAFDEVYLPMFEKLRPLVEATDKDASFYFQLVEPGGAGASPLPRSVLKWVRANERLLGVSATINQLEQEKAKITENQAWRGSKMGPDIISYLDANRDTLTKIAGTLAKNRMVEAFRNIKHYSDQADIVRFETSKAEKEIAEAGVDQTKLLSKQTLYKPSMPAENWNFWRFDGEFWIDEIGYYRYTLKRGCLARTE